MLPKNKRSVRLNGFHDFDAVRKAFLKHVVYHLKESHCAVKENEAYGLFFASIQ
jgi:hypothetical protein